MAWHVWIGFVLASAALGLVPGPGVMSIVAYAIGSGRRVALASVAGIAIGNCIAMILSLAGIGAVLAASALAFSAVKWAGALYLIAVGVLTIAGARKAADRERTAPPKSARAAFFANMGVGTLHPKTIVFFVAFAPQFIDPAGDYLSQAVLLVATFCGTVALTDTCYALAAARAAHLFRSRQSALWSKRASGGVLVAAGILTAARS